MKIRMPTDKEYEKLVELTGGDNKKMHWKEIWSWVNDTDNKQNLMASARAVRGFLSANYWGDYYVSLRYSDVGLRPTIEILSSDSPFSGMKEGDAMIIGTLFMDGTPIKTPQNPTPRGDIADYIPGATLEMREALDDPDYQVVGFRVGNALIADRCMLKMISYDDITAATAASRKILCVDMDGTIVVWRGASSEEDLFQKGFFLNVGAYPSVLSAVKEIIKTRKDIEVYIVSAVLNDSKYAIDEKNQWLDMYLPEVNKAHRIFTLPHETKAEAVSKFADFKHDIIALLDDYTLNLKEWVCHDGVGIKVMNGINGTNGTWCGAGVSVTSPDFDIANDIQWFIDREEHS